MANQQRQAPNPRLSDIIGKKFSGEANSNPYAHWMEWEDFCEAYNLTPQQKVDRFKQTLTADAREWISGKQFQNPDDLKDQFIQYFSGFSSRTASLEAFRGLKWIPGECIDRFAMKVTRLGERLQMGDELIQEQFLNGLPFEMKTAVIMSGAADLAEMKSKAQRFADLQKERQGVSHFAIQDTGIETLKKEMADLCIITKALVENQKQYLSYEDGGQRRYQERGRFQDKRRYQDSGNFRNRTPSRGRSSSRGRQDYYRDSSRGRNRDSSRNRYNRDSSRHRDSYQQSRDQSRGRSDSFRKSRDQSRGRSESRGRQVRIRDQTPGHSSGCWFCNDTSHGWKQCNKLLKELSAGNLKKDF